ncbi:MAG: aconitate hydratase AcnA, partial [Acidobacteriota bacterium]
SLQVGDRKVGLFRLSALEEQGIGDVASLPRCLKVLLENLLRGEDGKSVDPEDVRALASWDPTADPSHEIAFRPARVLLQDFTGVPAVVDLAAMRESLKRLGGDPSKINPLQPVDLVIDHSVQIDHFGKPEAFQLNVAREMERNAERYALLRWAQGAFDNFGVVPPGTGIIHQVNLEYLARTVFVRDDEVGEMAYPDSLVGTDSHTTMINGLGVLGWGVGGIEAEAAMLGQPVTMLIPQVVGFRLDGKLQEGATATDLVLTVTQALRERGVVGKFVEFYGPGLSELSLPDRATIANMAPEYGATMGFFPVDDETCRYLRFSGRSDEQVDLVEAYCKEQGLFRNDSDPDPRYSDTLSLDLAEVVPSLAGPRRPQDRVALREIKANWAKTLTDLAGSDEPAVLEKTATVDSSDDAYELPQGAVVIASITSCTNTSNPSVMVGAGLLAKAAREKGLQVKPWVKTSLAPGSMVVMDYLKSASLVDDLESLGFHLVGYGCTTCIGNSGPLPEEVAAGIKEEDLVVASVLSGNRNFDGRIHALVRANYLASPPLVVAYALAGRMDWDPKTEPLGTDADGNDVFLKDIWPSQQLVNDTLADCLSSEMYEKSYATVLEGTPEWQALERPEGLTFDWDGDSTYVREPPFFQDLAVDELPALGDISGARVLVMAGHSVTTDHISPAGAIAADSPAAGYLEGSGVDQVDFNSYGSRRGNHEVMMRGTFGNVRLRNLLVPGKEGNWTKHVPSGDVGSIHDTAMRYAEEGTPLVVLGGKEYGTGSSRDWAAKGTLLLGVKAVIVESFERIHRSNLVGMGVLPLQFKDGEGRESLGLTGEESFSIEGITAGLSPRCELTVTATADDGSTKSFQVVLRVDSPQELEYIKHGGILPYVLRQLAA